ncbi:MAG: hypothetical protein HJJLKODD_00561 [Phycisphaerae bacterium]|nr:hypothetical protein [Phycisphaerae bacterium]
MKAVMSFSQTKLVIVGTLSLIAIPLVQLSAEPAWDGCPDWQSGPPSDDCTVLGMDFESNGCYHRVDLAPHYGYPYRIWDAYETNVDPRWPNRPFNFPPRSRDAHKGSLPLVSGEGAHFKGPNQFHDRPIHQGTVDLIIPDTPLLQETDFELPFGSAVFRHIRTSAGFWNNSYEPWYMDWRPAHEKLWDWNGLSWMMSESPIFFMDSAQWYNFGLPRVCYLVVDAHYSIPFIFDENQLAYIAPPGFDAELAHNGQLDANGNWITLPTEFYIWLQERTIRYTIQMSYEDVPAEFHQPATSGVPAYDDTDELQSPVYVDCLDPDEQLYCPGRGIPYMGFVSRIEDRYGNRAEIEYCTPEQHTCNMNMFPFCEDVYPPEFCDDYLCRTCCENCNEKGQIKSIKLISRNSSGQDIVVWTLLYTHRSFGQYCAQQDIYSCELIGECPINDPSFGNWLSLRNPHALHSIHVYEGDITIPQTCLTLDYADFCSSTSIDQIDAINHPALDAIGQDWVLEVKYVYTEFQPYWGVLQGQSGEWTGESEADDCPITCSYDDGAAHFPYSWDGLSDQPRIEPGMLLIKTTVSRREESAGDQDTLSKKIRLYRYDDGTDLYSFYKILNGLFIYEPETVDRIVQAMRAAGDPSFGVNDLIDLPGDEEVLIEDPDSGVATSNKLWKLADLTLRKNEGSWDPWELKNEFINEYGLSYEYSQLISGLTQGYFGMIDRRPAGQYSSSEYRYYYINEYPADAYDAYSANGIPPYYLYYPYRYTIERTDGQWELGDVYKPLPAAQRFRTVVIDRLTDTEDISDPDEVFYDPVTRTELASRRVVEMNPAGIVLRDRTWSFTENPDGELVSSIGNAESYINDCQGRIIEKRTIGWNAEDNPDPNSEGLIYVYKYEDDSCAEWDAQQDRCECDELPPLWQSEGRILAEGIKQGRGSSPYSGVRWTKHWEWNEERPELPTREVNFDPPTSDYLSNSDQTTIYDYQFGPDICLPGVGCWPGPVQQKITAHPAVLQADGAGQYQDYHGVSIEIYNASGQTEWIGAGSLIDWSATPNVTTAREFYITHMQSNALGFPEQTIEDTNQSPPGSGWERVSSTAPLNYITQYEFYEQKGLKRIVYPNGHEDYIVWVTPDPSGEEEYRWSYRNLLITGEEFSALAPVEITHYSGGRILSSVTVELTNVFNSYPPHGTEQYEIIKTSTVAYDSQGRMAGINTESSDGMSVEGAISYDGFGQIARNKTADGSVVRYVYDQLGRVWKKFQGTRDQHEAWGTGQAVDCDELDCSGGSPPPECETICGDHPECYSAFINEDNLMLSEKRYYGEGVFDAGELVAMRSYRDKATNQYFEVIPDDCCEEPPCNPANNEDNIGWLNVTEYDWRMRPVWEEEQDESGAPISRMATFYDHQDRVRFTASYGPGGITAAQARAIGDQVTMQGDTFDPAVILATANLLSLMENRYNARGQVEEERTYNVAVIDGSSFTTSRTFYNYSDKPTEVLAPNSPVQKNIYDARERQVRSSVVAAGVEVSRSETIYDANDQPVQSTYWERRHDAAEPELTESNSVRSFSHTWFAPNGRSIATANYGTNGSNYTTGTPPAYDPQTPPATLDEEWNVTACTHDAFGAEVLVTCFGYDEKDNQNAVYNPDGTVTRTEFNGLKKTLLVTENADDPLPENRRVTAYRYDLDSGQLIQIAAVLPDHAGGVTSYDQIDWNATDSTLQVTEVIYGADVLTGLDSGGMANPLSASNAFIKEVRYPDPITGQPDPANYLKFTYFVDGSVATREDSRGVIFTHTYDELKRRIETTIDDSAWFVDPPQGQPDNRPADRIRRIVYDYAADGLLEWVTAYTINAQGQEKLVAQNRFEYDELRNLEREWQSHGKVVGANSPVIDYLWEFSPTDEYNFNRLVSMTYPKRPGSGTRRTVTLNYGNNSSDADSALSRVTRIDDSALGILSNYDYMGTGRRIGLTLGNGINQTVFDGLTYAGLDRYGRLVDLDYDSALGATLQRYQYGYDRAGNRTFARVTQLSSHDNDRSWFYQYDDLQRLVDAHMGELLPDNSAIVPTAPNTQHTWLLDNLGNWSGGDDVTGSFMKFTDADGDGTPDDLDWIHHAVNADNEIASLTADGSPPTNFIYDPAGNLAFDGTLVYQYDGFNHLAQVNLPGSAVLDGEGRIESGQLGTLKGRYSYDGLGRLVVSEQRPSSSTSRWDYYYDGVRRIAEVTSLSLQPYDPNPTGNELWSESDLRLLAPEDEISVNSTLSISDTQLISSSYTDREYIYGPSYVDEFVAQVDRYGNPWYILQDGNFNVTGLASAAGNIVHQYTYSPYGQIVAQEQLASHAANRVLHQGLFWDSAVGLYYNRNRWYDPELGRFIQKDPNETALPIITALASNAQSLFVMLGIFDLESHYGSGMNLYAYEGNNPISGRDPLGLEDPFAVADDVISDFFGDMAATLEWVTTKFSAGYNMASVIGGFAFSMLPGADAALLAIKLAMGDDVGWDDIAYAGLSVGGGALIGKLVGKTFKTLGRYGKRGLKKINQLAGDIPLTVLQKLCFGAGTMIWMADGSIQPIETIQVNDQVMCDYDPQLNNGPEICTVTNTFENIADETLELIFGDGQTEWLVVTTPEHPFYVAETNQFTKASALAKKLRDKSGSFIELSSKVYVSFQAKVYNLRVDQAHNYFVMGCNGKYGLLVHNTLCSPEWVKDANSFISWLKNLEHEAKSGMRYAKEEIDSLVMQARAYGVDIRLDPAHPGTAWNMPHINFGTIGVHIPVPPGYVLP